MVNVTERERRHILSSRGSVGSGPPNNRGFIVGLRVAFVAAQMVCRPEVGNKVRVC